MAKFWLLLTLCVPAHAANPTDLQFEIALPEGRAVWRQGERIPLILRLSSSTPDRWLAELRMGDRIGRLNGTEEFLVEPAEAVRDPLDGLPGQNGGLGGLSSGPVVLQVEPFEYRRDLNEWIEFTRPGAYSLTVTTRRVSGIKQTATAQRYPQGDGEIIELVSNTLNLQIVEAEPSWASEQVRGAVQMLGRSESSEDAQQAVRDGGRILRYLGARDAAFEMVRLLGGGGPRSPQYDFRLGILSSPHRAELLPFMEQRLAAPDQAVDDLFIATLAHLATLVSEGLPAPAPADPAERERWTRENRARSERFEIRRADYYGDLAAALNSKNAAAKAIGAAALSAYSSSQPSPPIALQSATELLGRYGSPDSEDVLWAALEALHRKWQGRAADFESDPRSEGLQLERALRAALAQGAAWVLDADGLKRLRRLCVSDWCRGEVDSWIAESAEPLPVSLSSADHERFSASIGRYHLRSQAELRAKMSQFHADTRFRWNPRPDLVVRPWLADAASEMERLLPGLQ